VDTGQGHTCAIRLEGALYCWGRNTQNQLGDVDSDQVREPIQVGTGSDWLAVEAGQNHTCGVREDRYAYCWGENNGIDTGDGAPLGIPGAALLETPTRVDGAGDVSVLRTDTFHSCAVTRDARFLCWGRNIEGQLGLGDDAIRETPTLVGSGYGNAAVGRFTTCAVREGGSLECTGDNRAGQLGAGDTMRRFALTPVEFPEP
jgi:alpha-tubulin suppressor-like RCC1 family protein